MNVNFQKIIITSILIFILTGCTSNNQNLGQTINSNKRAITGGTIGTILGAVIGHQISSKNSSKIIGAVAGGVIGSAIGYNLDKQAKELEEKLKAKKIKDTKDAQEIQNDILILSDEKYVKIIFKNSNFFEINDDVPSSDSASKLLTLSKVLKKYPNTIIQVTGHTDSDGSYEYNEKLSQKRANNVGEIIHSSNIENKIYARGCSFSKPLVKNNTKENKATNRRVEIYLFENENSVFDTCEVN
ncbi:MAG: OmpA family protein [Sulfurovum sp.]|jgi:outer membrane protein OmpA-like peptidoglycan-associated protein